MYNPALAQNLRGDIFRLQYSTLEHSKGRGKTHKLNYFQKKNIKSTTKQSTPKIEMYQQRKFSPAVEKALQEVCPSDDPIDAVDFNPIAYINAKFPNEESLKGFADFYDEVKKKKEDSETALLNAVKTQATTAGSAAKDLEDAQAAVVSLHHRVSEIKNKAAESEKKVQELCSNIRQLDIAKTNISSSLKALKRLQHWILNVKQLEKYTSERVFGECHSHLKSAMENSAFFAKYEGVKKFEELRASMASCTNKLEWQIKNTVVSDTVEISASTGSSSLDPDTIDNYRLACLVIDLLGKDSYQKIVDAYIKREMAAYERHYARGSQEAEFRLVTTRYTYFLKRLEVEYEMLESVFPPHWCVLQELCLAFCLKTRTELEYLLRVADMINVEELTYVMEGTVGFENALTARCRNIRKAYDQTTGAEIRLPEYRFNNMLLQCFDSHMSHYLRTEEEAVKGFLHPITCTGFIDDAEFVVPPPKVDGDRSNNGILLRSADDLFVFLSARLGFAKSLSQQQTLIDIAHIWIKELHSYCNVLRSTVRSLVAGASVSGGSGGGGALGAGANPTSGFNFTSTFGAFGGSASTANFSSSPNTNTLRDLGASTNGGSGAGGLNLGKTVDYTRVCMLINTISYCATTIEAIQTSFLDPKEGHIASIKNGPSADTDGLSEAFEALVDDYKTLYAEAIGSTIAAIKTECVKLLWEARYPLLLPDNDHNVSAYAASIASVVRARWGTCALLLEEGHTMSYFLDKLAHEVADAISSGLFRPNIDVIPASTVERLIVDCKALQQALVALPYMVDGAVAVGAGGGAAGSSALVPSSSDGRRLLVENPKRYVQRVERSFDRHYKNLQMLLIPCALGDDKVPETYLTVTNPSDWSLFHFERLMVLKGIPRDRLRSWLTALSKRDVPDGRPRSAADSSGAGGGAGSSGGGSSGGAGSAASPSRGGVEATYAALNAAASPQRGTSASVLGALSGGLVSGGGGRSGGGLSSDPFAPTTSSSGMFSSDVGRDGVAQLADGTKAIMGVFKGGAKAFTGAAAKLGKEITNIGGKLEKE